ncbi:hypothetical protein BH10BAC4_BH10BAC4_11920 [soil metagenome]
MQVMDDVNNLEYLTDKLTLLKYLKLLKSRMVA